MNSGVKLVLTELVGLILMVVFVIAGELTGFSGWRDLVMIDIGVMAVTTVRLYSEGIR